MASTIPRTEKMPQEKQITYIIQITISSKWLKQVEKDLAMASIDNKMFYDVVPQTLILECLKMSDISDKVVNFIMKAMGNLKMKLSAGGQILAGIGFLSLLFVIAMMQSSYLLMKFTEELKFTKSQEKVNSFTYMGDIKIFTKNVKELESLVQIIWIYSQITWMESGI